MRIRDKSTIRLGILFLASAVSFSLVPIALIPNSVSAQVAPDATNATGALLTTATEYRLPATIDSSVLADRNTELWAVVHRPATLSSTTRYPVIVFLHGNHATCGTGANPRIDSNSQYTTTGTCPAGFVVVPNHRGYDYLARNLASWGYIVVSINSNRGINAGAGVAGDAGLIAARGRLILRHLQLLSQWDRNGGTPASLGVSLQNRLDFSRVGLMGHSRGGEGVRAAYNLYTDVGSTWRTAILSPVTFNGIFEFAPTDFQNGRTFNAPNVAWNVVLPACDGDVSNLSGIKPFDRMFGFISESPATFKSSYVVWGANHNYFNTEWQTSDSTGCTFHTPIFTPGPSVGSASQQAIGRGSLLAFMRGNISGAPGFSANLRQNFNPQYALPSSITAITRVTRGYTDSPNQTITLGLEDFRAATGTSRFNIPNVASNLTITHGAVAEHDSTFRAGNISWTSPGTNTFFQTNFANLNQGINLSAYSTLDLRLDNQAFASTPTNFSVALVLANNTTSTLVPISNFGRLDGPVAGSAGTVHATLQTVRIPLTSFSVPLTSIRGVRLVFNQTTPGRIFVANIQASNVSLGPSIASPLSTASLDAKQPQNLASSLTSLTDTSKPANTDVDLPKANPSESPLQKQILDGNRIVRIRKVSRAKELQFQPGVEIELSSNQIFPSQGELPILRIGSEEFLISRYPDSGDMHRLIFTIPQSGFNRLTTVQDMWVQYGQGDNPPVKWLFGRFRKN